MELKTPPFRFTPKQDDIILKLFNVVSTEKLSILMNVSIKLIVIRYKQLTR